MKVTKKGMIDYVNGSNVIDITTYSSKEIDELTKKEMFFYHVVESYGSYGINGCIVQGSKSRQLYAITSRNSNLFRLI